MATGEKLGKGVFSTAAPVLSSSSGSEEITRNSFVGPQNVVSRSWISIRIGVALSSCSCWWTAVRKSLINCSEM